MLLEALRDVRGEMSVEDLSRKTFIMATDVTDTLQVGRGEVCGSMLPEHAAAAAGSAASQLEYAKGSCCAACTACLLACSLTCAAAAHPAASVPQHHPCPASSVTHSPPLSPLPPPQALGLLKYIKGSYYISASQRVVEEHLRCLQGARGLELDPSCLHWQPLQSPGNQGRKK